MPDKDVRHEPSELLERLGSSAPEVADENGVIPETGTQRTFDPYGSGDYRETKTEWGQSDKTGWGNQGNWGNEGYFQGYESRPEDRTQNPPEEKDQDKNVP